MNPAKAEGAKRRDEWWQRFYDNGAQHRPEPGEEVCPRCLHIITPDEEGRCPLCDCCLICEG
jgi:uncharacterized paraquat-inducible protein A